MDENSFVACEVIANRGQSDGDQFVRLQVTYILRKQPVRWRDLVVWGLARAGRSTSSAGRVHRNGTDPRIIQ
jgi:hypothetical protein